jgi:ABC-2 type transport system ATP-binding protein
VWEIVRSIAAGGTTVLLTTQYLEEADRLAAAWPSSTTAG